MKKAKAKSKVIEPDIFDYMSVPVGTFVRSEKGFYRKIAYTLEDIFKQKEWDKAVLAFRKSKTKQNPKGDQELKKSIRAFQPSGDYGPGVSRSIKNELATATHLVQLDFDSKKEKFSDALIKKLFDKYKWIAIAQRSCGGAGFYLLVHTPSAKNYANYFGALCDFFAENEKLTVDRAVSSVNEIRFVSLSSEAHIRRNATQWTQEKKFVASTMERVLVPLDGKILPLPDDLNDPTGAHYDDIIAWAGKQNSNGVPLEKALEGFEMSRISKNSSHYNNLELVQYAIERVYETYSEQHGVAVVTDVMINGDVDLPKIQFFKGHKIEIHVQKIVDNVVQKYFFKTEASSEIIHRFTGTHWQMVEDPDIRNFLSDCARVSGYPSDVSRLKNTRDLLVEDLVDRSRCKFDTPLNMFNVKNGVLKFESGNVTLEPHSDKHNFTYILDYEYDPKATQTKYFDKFINRVLPDKETQQMIFDYIGSAFIPNDVIKIEKTLILLGSGANGKSTLLGLIQEMFGDAIGNFNLERLTDPKTSELEIPHIMNKILGVCGEARQIKDHILWKAIVSREAVNAKKLYFDTFTTTNYGRMITCMNEMPRIDAVAGSMRRAIIVGMNVQVPEAEQDTRLITKLREDRSAVLNLIIEGYKKVFKSETIEQSEQSKKLTMGAIDENDQVRQFLLEKRWFPISESQDMSTKLSYTEKMENHAKDLKLNGEIKLMSIKEIYTEYKKQAKADEEHFTLSRLKFKERLTHMTAKRLGRAIDPDATFKERRVAGESALTFTLIEMEDESNEVPNKPRAHKPIKKAPF